LHRRSIFWRLLLRSLSVRQAQTALALASLVVGAAVVSTLLNLWSDARREMTQEFRAYGANVLLAPAATPTVEPGGLDGLMPEETLARLEPIEERSPGMVAVPVLYVVARLARVPRDARLPEFENAVVAGTDFSALQRVFPSWRVTGPQGLDSGACAIGARVASRLRVGVGDRLELAFESGPGSHDTRRQEFRVSSLVETGASEDDQVFVPLAALQSLASLEGRLSLVELSVPGRRAEIEAVAGELHRALPGLDVRPVRQIVDSEGRVLGILRTLMASLASLILVIMALCVAATMTAVVLERQRDIAVMKALGADDRTVLELFLGEASLMGLVGGATGFALGGFAAQRLGERLFGAALHVVWWTLPVVCLASVAVALVATSFPIRIIRGVEPAVVLKGQ